MAPRNSQTDVNDKSGNVSKDVHYQGGTTQNSSGALYSSTPASATITTPQAPALSPVTRLSNHLNDNTSKLFPRATIAKPAKPWTHFYMKGGMAMEDHRKGTITSMSNPQIPLHVSLRGPRPHPNPNPNPAPPLNLAKSIKEILEQRPMVRELLSEIVGPQTTSHTSHGCVEEGVEKNVIPAARNFESSSSLGVLDTQPLPPSTTKKNGTPWPFDLNLPAPEQEDDEDEGSPSLPLSLGLNI